MHPIVTDIESYISTVAEIIKADGLYEALDILKKATIKAEETGYDNWNGGTKTFTIYLQIYPKDFAKLGDKKTLLQDQIKKRLESVVEQFTSDWIDVKIYPRVSLKNDWRNDSVEVSRETKKLVFDSLRLDKIVWSGQLNEVEFLERLYDLRSMPSNDGRYKTAATDIWQHRVNNPEDWPDDWIYSDSRFKLLDGPSDVFLSFLCEMINPVVRPDKNETIHLVKRFNEALESEGWIILEEERLVGRHKFIARRKDQIKSRAVNRAKSVAEALDAGWMQKEIERLENAVENDPSLAIGTAKELVETCCKSILASREIPYSRNIDLPDLTKTLLKELKLVPDGISEDKKGHETIRLILRNLGSLTQYLTELRGLYGSGHGRDGKYRGLEPRHARLAVGAATTFIDFVTETHKQRKEVPNKKD